MTQTIATEVLCGQIVGYSKAHIHGYTWYNKIKIKQNGKEHLMDIDGIEIDIQKNREENINKITK